MHVGLWLSGNVAERRTIQRPSMLVYTQRETQGSTMIGVYSEAKHAAKIPIPRTKPDLTPGLQDSWVVPFSEDKYFSSARLESVHTAKVFFRSQGSKFCTGVIFQYENGGQRAVGQCRPTSDACVEYSSPSFICITKATSIRGYDVKTYQSTVEFFGAEGHHSEDSARCCHAMSGAVLYFWFSAESTFLQVVKVPKTDGS